MAPQVLNLAGSFAILTPMTAKREVPIPELLADRPMDPRRGIPVPFMNQSVITGEMDFVKVFHETTEVCARDSLCGICGKKRFWLSAFVGGPISEDSHVYSNPPFHPECAAYAIEVCPYITIGRHRRAEGQRAEGAVNPSDAMELNKPKRWVMGISHTDKVRIDRFPDGFLMFIAGPWVSKRTWVYTSQGQLVEVAGER